MNPLQQLSAAQMVDKVALITGGGAGIGRASALEFSKQGCNVLVVDIDASAAQETCRLIKGEVCKGRDACLMMLPVISIYEP